MRRLQTDAGRLRRVGWMDSQIDEWEGFWKLGRRPEVLQAGACYRRKGGGSPTLLLVGHPQSTAKGLYGQTIPPLTLVLQFSELTAGPISHLPTDIENLSIRPPNRPSKITQESLKGLCDIPSLPISERGWMHVLGRPPPFVIGPGLGRQRETPSPT